MYAPSKHRNISFSAVFPRLPSHVGPARRPSVYSPYILLVVVSQLVEEVQNPLPLLRGHIVEALQPATTGRACFSGIDISSSGVPVCLTGVEGVLFDVSFPPAKKETQLNGFIFIELVESFFIESCFVRLTSW